MELVKDIITGRKLIETAIQRHGSSPEHNFSYYQNIAEAGGTNVFISFGNQKGILAQHFPTIKTWMMIGDVLASQEEKMTLLNQAIENLLGPQDKFVVETSKEMREKLLFAKKFKVGTVRFPLHWPVFEFSKWNGENLQGGDWKKLRNIKNQFYKAHTVQIVDSAGVEKEKLKKLVMDWVSTRRQTSREADRVKNNKEYYERYINFVETGFEGCKHAKTILVDENPVSITAGWMIPNSDNGYYSAIGIYDSKLEGIGEVANMEDLAFLKQQGYKFVDFGGSPESLLNFKLKFKPTFVYTSYTYPISKK